MSTWAWRKSSASGSANDECVEIAWTGRTVLVRDSARPRGAVVAVGPDAWDAFLSSVAGNDPVHDVAAARP
ncbi:DUF397 domain-containing protein [Streptomyces sp. NPDC018029]|uniref:DUF397 domain-containing protein n=1 Tax=Streptomyces sp. NPDC018029 TaxID=3365032 RepID=UPI0037943F82